jgi:hypothetical protein
MIKLKNEIFSTTHIDAKTGEINSFMIALEQLTKKHLNPARGFVIMKLFDEILTKQKAFEAIRLQLCERLGKINPKTNSYDFEIPENKKQFDEGFKELCEIEQEYVYDKISLPEEINGIPFTIPTFDLYLLKDILIIPE